MCLIVDANMASRALGNSLDPDCVPVRDWLFKGDGCLVFGGRLASELDRVSIARKRLLELNRAGRARRIDDSAVQEEQQTVDATGLCRSNDSHVVALARVSGARVLCTGDGNLRQDFKNPELVSKPRGKLYQREEHAHLLVHSTSCGRRAKRR
jgi:hypothetical protein